MIIVILLASFTITVSTSPVRPNVLPPLLSQGGATQAPRVQPQTPATLYPGLEQAQAGVLKQPGAQDGPQLVPSLPHYTWFPLGGSTMMIPMQPSIQESLPSNQPALPHQPLVFPPYGYFPLFLSPYMNQLFSTHRFPTLPEAQVPQPPANLPPQSQVLPAETPNVAAPLGEAPQPVQQVQNGQIMYMIQQPMSFPLGSLSSEELEIAARMSQLGVYMPTVLTNLPAGAVQAAGIAQPEQQGTGPNDGMPAAGVPQTQGLAISGPQRNTNKDPEGLKKAAQDAASVQTPVQPKRPQGNPVKDCGHQQHTGV